MTESPQTQSEISIHQLVVGKPANDGNIPAQCELLRCSLQEYGYFALEGPFCAA